MIGGSGRVSGGGRGWKIWERLENLGEVGILVFEKTAYFLQ